MDTLINVYIVFVGKSSEINASGAGKRKKKRLKSGKPAVSAKNRTRKKACYRETGGKQVKTCIKGNVQGKKVRKKFFKQAKNLLHRQKDLCIIPMLSVQG